MQSQGRFSSPTGLLVRQQPLRRNNCNSPFLRDPWISLRFATHFASVVQVYQPVGCQNESRILTTNYGNRFTVVEQRSHTCSMSSQLNTETHTSCQTDPVKAQSSANSLHASFCRCKYPADHSWYRRTKGRRTFLLASRGCHAQVGRIPHSLIRGLFHIL